MMTLAWTPPDWRDAAAYASVLVCGRPALAWELLRRDPDYRAAVANAGVGSDIGAHWGLHFRG